MKYVGNYLKLTNLSLPLFYVIFVANWLSVDPNHDNYTLPGTHVLNSETCGMEGFAKRFDMSETSDAQYSKAPSVFILSVFDPGYALSIRMVFFSHTLTTNALIMVKFM